MSRSIYWKITVPFVLIILASMGILAFYIVTSTRNSQILNLQGQLENEARLVAAISLPAFAGPDSNNFDQIAKATGKEIQARITIIAVDGTVLGDTEQDPLTMDNHASRPEVAAALSSGTGQSTRYSSTLNEDMMYVAVPVVNRGQIMGVARVALPLAVAQNPIDGLATTIFSTMAIFAFLVILAAAVIAGMITRPVRRMTLAAEAIAMGKLAQRVPVENDDEIGRLGCAFNQMSSNVGQLITEISAERAKLQGVLANMADGVIVTDSEGRIVLANQAAENLFNFQKDNVALKPLIEAVSQYEVDEVLKRCRKTDKPETVQFELLPSRRYLRAIAVPILEGKLTGTLLLFQDLTEVRSLQTMRRELVGNVSHEFRTPIAGIKAMVETIQMGAIEDRETTKDFLRRINDEADRLTQMVSELIELSRIEMGRGDFRLSPVDLNTLVEEVAAQMRPLAERQQVTIASILDKTPPTVRADKERIRQTIINLVHNAIKFNHPGGRITLSTKSENGVATVSVTDTGIGISREDLPHVFERFFKADKARASEGSGLGLAIAKHTIQEHGGTIRAESEEGKGSVFTFSLPSAPSQPRQI